jgi:hypothetical protein
MVTVAVLLPRRLVLLDGLPQAQCIVVFLFQVFPAVHQGVIAEFLGEEHIFCPAGEHQFLAVHLFIGIPRDDWCPFCLVERAQMMGDVAGVEFHAGEIFHLVRYKQVKVGDAGGTGIEHQDAACSESWFDLLVGGLEVLLIVDVSRLNGQSNREL